MRDQEIHFWTASLINSLGQPRPEADACELERLHKAGELAKMLGAIRDKLNLNMRLRLARVNVGGLDAPMWIEVPKPMPVFGTRAFRNASVTVYIRKTFITRAPYGAMVVGMAHELSHVVLEALRHPLRNQEEAVDLAAMLLGFRDIFEKCSTYKVRRNLGWRYVLPRNILHLIGQTNKYRLGYLSEEEVRYAASLMRYAP